MPDSSAPVALITGAARRVGRAVALELASIGHDIAITYHSSQDQAQALLDQLRAMGRRAIAIPADFNDPEPAVEEIHRQVAGTFARLDVLVNNASIYAPGNLATTTLASLRQAMSIHVETPLLLAQKFQTLLRAARGSIVNMSDLLAQRPWPEFLAYSASKAALSNLTQSLARLLAPDVRVNAIAPGVVEWPDDYPESARQNYLKRVPLARAGTPRDVARLIRFLVTEGSYLTGQILPLDGGRSIT